MAEFAKFAVLNLRDYGITIGGKDFPWFVGDNISVETETDGTDTGSAFRRLRLDVLIDGDVIIEGDPRLPEQVLSPEEVAALASRIDR